MKVETRFIAEFEGKYNIHVHGFVPNLIFLIGGHTAASLTKYILLHTVCIQLGLLQMISLISAPAVPPIDFGGLSRCDLSSAAQRIVRQNSSKKHAGLHTAKRYWMSSNILVFLAYCIFYNLFLAY